MTGKENFSPKSRTCKASILQISFFAVTNLLPVEIAHRLLDLMIQFAQNPSASTSPSTPSSPSPHLSRHPANHPHVTQAQVPYDADQLLRLKIAIREGEYPPRERASSCDDVTAVYSSTFGNNEGTMRFLFAPPGA